MEGLGPWRKPKSLRDARDMADTIIDSMDPEWLIRFGLNLLGATETAEYVVSEWVQKRRPPLGDHLPYFVFMLKINIFFCLVLPTQLLSKVKPSHMIDLAYLYYLPFCSVFTSKDNFHADIVPLFLSPEQTFVNGIELKNDLKRLVAHYEALPEEVLKTGLIQFAAYPPDDTSFLITRLWDKYLPGWRAAKTCQNPHVTRRRRNDWSKKLTGRRIHQSCGRATNRILTRWITQRSAAWCILSKAAVRFSEE